jgi:cobalt-zinc-cadmium efflux system membrane fusion protein
LLLGVTIGRAAAPRPLPPLVVAEPPAIGTRPHAFPSGAPIPERVAAAPAVLALAAILLLPVMAGAQPLDAPRRQPDGSIFVPKPSQRLLGLRTGPAELGEAPVTIRLTGQVVADPNASGRVQASEAGRIEPPESGFPALGQRVSRGEVLGFVVPIMAAQDRVGVRASIAELDALIVIGEARVRRLTALAGTVAAREISDARADLEGLRQRRAANLPAVTGREPILAPSAGLISVVRVAAGQVIQAQEPLFDIVDPARLWVEAIAFDPAAVADISGASAMTAGGQALRLGFVGRGMTLRQQGLPLHFRIEGAAPGLAVGQPVTVLVETPRRTAGIVLPAEAVVRNPEGGQVVYEMPSAERFLPRPVRTQPLDGQRVLVTAGLERGARVVTSGAGLIAQVR